MESGARERAARAAAAASRAAEPQPDIRELALAPAPPEPKKTGEPLVEFSTVTMDDPNEGIVFGDSPARCTCPHCDRTVVTFIDYEASWVTWLLGAVVWFSLGWMAFWVLPLLWPAFKDVVHHCPRCLNVITRKSRISVPTFRSEVMSFKVGSCAVVLARKYVAILLGLVLLIVAACVLRSTVGLNTTVREMHRGPPSMLTWEDFLAECGPKTSLRQRSTTSHAFDEKFRHRTFTWRGEVHMIREGIDVLFVHTKSVVLIRMYPNRYPRRESPDVVLLFGEDKDREVGELMPGDWVEFEATMEAHGYRGDPEIMGMWHIRKLDKRPEPLSSSAHLRDLEDGAHGPEHESDGHREPHRGPHGEAAPAAEAAGAAGAASAAGAAAVADTAEAPAGAPPEGGAAAEAAPQAAVPV